MENFRLPKAAEIKYFEQADYKRKVEGARYRMRPRPFTERFNKLNIIAKIGTFFFPLISILTAISFLLGYIYDATGFFYLSIFLAIFILTLLETSKNHLFSNALDTHFSNSGKTILTFLFALIFSVISFIMSYQGAEILVRRLDNSKVEINESSSSIIASINNSYNKQIKTEQKKIEEIKSKAKKQWRGLNTPEQNRLILVYEQNIKLFREQRQKEIDNVLANQQESITNAESKTDYNSLVFKVFAGTNEFLTILSITFCAFYAFKTVRQDLDLTDYRENQAKYSEPPGENNSVLFSDEKSSKMSFTDLKPERKTISGFYRQGIIKDKLPNIDYTTLTVNNHRRCKNCGNVFEYKHWNKQYCSDECRIAYWEQRTGKKLTLKKSKAQ